MDQYVYFIQAGKDGPVKIGVAADPRRRLWHLQTGAHDELTLLGTARGGQEREGWLHIAFAADRVRGEWFRPSSELYCAVSEPEAPHALREKIASLIGGESVSSFNLAWVMRDKLAFANYREREPENPRAAMLKKLKLSLW